MSVAIIRRIPTRNQSDQIWIAWYDALRKEFGRKKANQLYIANWDSQNGDDSDANTSTLRTHLEKYGIDVSGGVLGGIKDFGLGTAGFIGDYFTAGKIISIGLASIVAISIGAIIIQIATRDKVRAEAVRVGSAVATRGVSEVGKK